MLATQDFQNSINTLEGKTDMLDLEIDDDDLEDPE